MCGILAFQKRLIGGGRLSSLEAFSLIEEYALERCLNGWSVIAGGV